MISPTYAPVGPSTGPSRNLRRIHCGIVVASFRTVPERICLGKSGRVFLCSQITQLCVCPSARVGGVRAVLWRRNVGDDDVLVVSIELHGVAPNEGGELFRASGFVR